MKLVAFSDLHLDTQFQWAPPAVARKRRQALRDTLGRITQLAVEISADAVLCGGDLYEHDRFSPDTGAFLRSTFAKLHPMPVFIAPGNHDWYGPASLYRNVDWSSNVHIYTEARLEPMNLTDGLTLWGAAHRAPANTGDFLRGFRVDAGGVHIALFHGSEASFLSWQESGKLPHAPFDSVEIESAGLHHAFLGHYHRPRDEARHTYPGNPEPLTFGEDGERGVVVAEVLADGTVTRERRRVSQTDVHDKDVDITECDSMQDVRDRIADALVGLSGLARVTLSGELRPDVDLKVTDLNDVAPWTDATIVRVGVIRPGYDLDRVQSEQTVRGEFVREVMATELPDEEKRRILATGLRALDGRDDLEVF